MSFDGMSSSMSLPMSPLDSPMRGASTHHMIGMEPTTTTNNTTIHEAPITICPDMISRDIYDTPETSAVPATWSSSSDDFIPMRKPLPSFPLEGKPTNPRLSAHTTSGDGLPLPLRRTKRIKTYECDRCDMVFPRASDLRTHQNVHAGEERAFHTLLTFMAVQRSTIGFTCEFPNCKKKFGVRANLLRHSAMHQIPKTVSNRSTARLTFAPPEKVPRVYSDTVPMHAGIAWDNEEATLSIYSISSILQVPKQRNPNSFDNM
ncbi:hypothetical protein B0H11DRAFT_2320690 [Mycena galericulata]|nr:hypothetical protein B0H11DRAFT_2320690 [Mycena galericulata]